MEKTEDEVLQEISQFLAQDGIEPESAEEPEKKEPKADKEEHEIQKVIPSKAEAKEEKKEIIETDKELSDFEKEQQAKGWNPNGVKSAEEFARAKPLYNEIQKRGRQIERLTRTVEELKEYMTKVEEKAYNKALNELEEQRKQAMANGDTSLVDELDKQKKELKPNIPISEHPAVSEFKERNPWMTGTSFEEVEMQKWAIQRDAELMAYGLSPEEHIKTLEEHLHKKFPEQFSQLEEPRKTSQAVESNTGSNVARQSSDKKKFSFRDLNDQQKQCARDFERMKVMSVDDYIKSLVDDGVLK